MGTALIMPDKGKDERGVGYVKSNAIAGRQFASWASFEAHLEQWIREVADIRVHGTRASRRSSGPSGTKPLRCIRSPDGRRSSRSAS